jgi:hypothetical protein
MRFQVPQFIEVEDKIFGPFTLRQFIYLAGAGGVVAIIWGITSSLFWALVIGGPIVALGLALAFYKVNDRPFVDMLQSALRYTISNRLYLWKKHERAVSKKEEGPAARGLQVPAVSHSKLKDLAWNLDVQDNVAAQNREHS